MNIKIAIVVAKFNKLVTKHLLEGAQEALVEAGILPENITVTWVPGAFELPLVAHKIATLKKADGILCLGCVIRGDTAHFDYVAGESAKGIAAVAMTHMLPVSFGVLAVDESSSSEDERQEIQETPAPAPAAPARDPTKPLTWAQRAAAAASKPTPSPASTPAPAQSKLLSDTRFALHALCENIPVSKRAPPRGTPSESSKKRKQESVTVPA